MRALLLLVLAVLVVRGADGANPEYVITDLGMLTALQDTSSTAFEVNPSGWIVGNSYASTRHAFLWSPSSSNATTGTITDLGGLPGFTCIGLSGGISRLDTVAGGISAANQVVGSSFTGPGSDCLNRVNHAFTYSHGVLKDLGVPSGFTESFGHGINNSGQVVGTLQENSTVHAFLYDGTFHDLGALPGYPLGVGSKVNQAGEIIGISQSADFATVHGFRHTGSGPLTSADDVGTLGGPDTVATGLNDSGVIVGASTLADGTVHAFLLAGTIMTDLGTLSSNPTGTSRAAGINSSKDVVGNADVNGSGTHAVIWKGGGGIVDLNTLIDTSSGWVLTIANAINDSGQIVGQGVIGGAQHAFLLTPNLGIVSLTLKSGTVCGPFHGTGTVKLASPAGSGGASVTILSTHPNIADGPATVNVPEGATTASFPITTHDVTVSTPVTLKALFAGQVVTANLTVQSLLSSFELSPDKVCSRTTAIATVTLACPAETATPVLLSSSNSELGPVPSQLIVPAGQNTASLSMTGGDTLPDVDVTITAAFQAEKRTGTLQVGHMIDNLAIKPATVQGVQSAVGIVTLACPAPKGGLPVSLLSDNSEVARPSVPSITFPAKAKIGKFTINTRIPTAETCGPGLSSAGTCQVSIVAEGAGSNQTASITVTQPGPPTATDVTQLVTVVPSGFRLDHATGRYLQEVAVTNQLFSLTSIKGPIALVLGYFHPNDSDPDPWTLVGGIDPSNGVSLPLSTTKVATPKNRQYVLLPLSQLPKPGVLNPGDFVTVVLTFDDPGGSFITYSPAVLADGAF